MQTTEDLNLDIIKKLSDASPVPMVLFDSNLNIIHYNQKAGNSFGISLDFTILQDIFSSPSKTKLERFFEECVKSNKLVREITVLELHNGKILRGEISISEIHSDPHDKLLSFIFSESYYLSENTNIARLSVRQDELDSLLNNKKIVQIIDEIKSSFPFTFLGKNKVSQDINKLDEFFWIKDANDYIVLSNKKFAVSLGLRPAQMEGKTEKSFLPSYYVDFYRSIESYIKESLNTMVLDGVPFRGLSSWQNFETIEVPLIDAENNVLAIIGITQKKAVKYSSTFSREKALFEAVNLPMMLIDAAGQTIISSSKFDELLLKYRGEDFNLFSLFDDNNYKKITDFIENSELNTFSLNDFAFKNDESLLFSILFDKSFSANNAQNFLVVTFLEQNQNTNFEDIIKLKGKMFDLLVRYNPEPIFIYDTDNLRFLEVNDAALSLYGYKRSEFLQLDLTDLYTPEDIQSLLDNTSSFESVASYQGPFNHRRKDGGNILIKIAKLAFEYEGHKAFFNIIQNVTGQTKTANDNIMFSSLFESSSDIIIKTDSVGFITEANEAANHLLTDSSKKLIGNSLIEFVSDDSRADVNTKIFFSGITSMATLNISIKNPLGKNIPAILKAVPVLSSEKDSETFLIIITPDHETIEIIKEVPVEVIREVPAGISDSNSSSSSSSGLELSQLSMMFHEILTPINVMLGFLQEIRDSLDNPSLEQKEAIDYINQNRDNLLNIMNSVSEYAQARVSAQELIPSEILFSELFDKVMAEDKDTFRKMKKEISIGKISNSLTFYSDKDKFKHFVSIFIRILVNISDEEMLTLSAHQLDDFSFAVVVRDEPNKVSEKLQTNFESFFKGNSHSSPKTFNLSRYSFLAVKTLVDSIGGQYHTSLRSGKSYEIGFKFPLNLFEEKNLEHSTISVSNFDEETVPTQINDDKFDTDFNFDTKYENDSESAVVSNPVSKPPVEEDFDIPIDTKFSFQSGSKPNPNAVTKQRYEPISDSFSFEEVTKSINNNIDAEQPVLTVDFNPPHSRRTAVTEPIKESPAKSMELGSMKCLYIEDQVDSQILFKVQMKEMQEIKFAVSFEEALPLLTSYNFDFIVMDINLQGEYNGLDALKMIHQMPGFQNIPIIAVTAYVLPGDKEKFIAAGFNDFISKPIFREKLIESLERIFLS